MALEIGIEIEVQFIGFEAVAAFGFFVLLDVKKLLQYFG